MTYVPENLLKERRDLELKVSLIAVKNNYYSRKEEMLRNRLKAIDEIIRNREENYKNYLEDK